MVKSRARRQKTRNRKRIVQLLAAQQEMTILDISRQLEISIPTVTKNIKQLMSDGIVTKAGVSESTGGRRPMVIKFLPNAYYSVGVEFSMQYIRIVVINLCAEIKADHWIRNPDFSQPEEIMHMVRHNIETLLEAHQMPWTQVLGLGFSLPGLVNERTRFLRVAPNLSLKNMDFSRYEADFGVPVFIENDANSSAIAELKLGLAQNMRNLVYVSILPKGIGTGVVVDGKLYRGENHRAGEYGHTTVASLGRRCSCGRKDCWELYASGNSLLDAYEEQCGVRFHALAEFFLSVEQQDADAQEVLDEYLDYLALGIQDIILVQDPHYVVLGGVITPYQHLFLEQLREKVFIENDFYNMNEVELWCSGLQADASILGVSLLPIEQRFPLFS